MNADVDCGTVCFFALNTLDVNHKFLAVNLNDLAHLLTFVVTSDNLHIKHYVQEIHHFTFMQNGAVNFAWNRTKM